MMMNRSLTVAAALMLATPAFAQMSGEAMTDAQFVEVAAVSNLYEIETSRLALQQAQEAETKAFAQKMIDDHTKAANELKAAAAKAGGDVKLPTALDAEHQKMLSDLKAEDKGDFDDAYIDAQVDAHEKAVALFDTYSKTGKQTDLKAFAAKTLPVLQSHHESIQKLD